MIKEYKITYGINDYTTMLDNEIICIYRKNNIQTWVNNKLEQITGIAKSQRGDYIYFINGIVIDFGTKEGFKLCLKKAVFE